MSAPLKTLSALCGAGVLLGCTANPQTAENKIVPTMTVRHSYESADGYYALGRYYHGAQRHEEARKAYVHALSLEPHHVKAGNALAVLSAETGDLRQAADLLQKLAVAAPDAAHLFSNLGRVYFLDGQYEAARHALEKATALDPTNVHAWNNLGSVLDKLGRAEQSREMFARARAAATANSAPPAMQAEQGATGTRIRAVSPGLYEVRQARPMQAASGFVSSTASTAPVRDFGSASPTRIEVSNGNGVTGMAKSVSRLIASDVLKVVRLTNQKRFAVQATRIEYNAGYERMARGLANRLGPSVTAMPSSIGPAADVRIVLGKDLPDARTVRANYLGEGKLVEADPAHPSGSQRPGEWRGL